MADIMVQLQRLANENTAKTFEYNTKEAKASRTWQTNMSNTSHQRETRDLIASGLNPVLSANSGAQSYTTSSASATADSAVNAMGNVQSSRNSAAATRYAADQSLKASQALASAQMYAARMSYEAQKYNADMNYKGRIDTNLTGTAKSIARGLLGDNFEKDLGNNIRAYHKNPNAEISKGSSVAKVMNNLTDKGVQFYGFKLRRAGIEPTPYNIALLCKAIALDDVALFKQLEHLKHKPLTARHAFGLNAMY